MGNDKVWMTKSEASKCIRCKSDRILDVSGKTSDCFNATYKGNEYDGYVLTDVGMGDDSDCINIKYCLNCGQIQGKFPIDENKIKEQMEDGEDEEEREDEENDEDR